MTRSGCPARRAGVAMAMRGLVAATALAWFGLGSAAAAISEDEVRVGLLVDMKSVYSHITGRGSEIAARMAIEDVGGRVAGKPIRLLVEDHGNSVERVRALAHQWLDEDGVDVIADVAGSPLALAVQEVNRARQAVIFYNGVMTTEITGKACAPTGIHWMYDSYAFTTVLGRELAREGKQRWHLLSVDNAFGRNAALELEEKIRDGGGRVVGRGQHALGEREYFARLRAGVAAGADVIALANAGQDTIQAVRQGYDLLDVASGKIALAAVATTLNDVHQIGPALGQGLKLAHAFYWNLDARSRSWALRFFARAGSMPNDLQAGVYSALMHYFKAVEASKTDDGPMVVAAMRKLPIDDPIVRNARLRADGRMVHDVFLLEVKKPSDVREPWDVLRILRTIPGEQAFRPLLDSECPLLKR